VDKSQRLRYKPRLMTAKPRPGFALADRDDVATSPTTETGGQPSIVSSHNEWDPLEEVVVGVLEGAAIPDLHFSYEASLPEGSVPMFRGRGGHRFEEVQFANAVRELDAFVRRLESEGVVVKRPDPVDHARPFRTPSWQSSSGLYSAMPRDLLIVIGNQLIEAPLAWRCRYFEIEAYRSLLKSYFKQGAQWIAAPRPTLRDEHFHEGYSVERGEWVTTEYEPTFDAADFARFGQDIFVQRSHVTNRFGIEWFARHLGPRYRLHEIAINDPHAMHIDATLVPLRPGTVLIHPERIVEMHPLFKGWDVLVAPPPVLPASWPMYMSSAWVSMNVLMLDESRVLIERQETPLQALLERAGFECIPVDFRHVWSFGGSFHCVTLDVRRRGTLQDYFH
jgi:glycine amidinotransferase